MVFQKHAQANDKKAKPVLAKDGDTILRVEPYMHFGKHTLRPFTVDGLPIFLPKGIEKEKKLYTCKALRDQLDHMNSELCRRPAIGLSEKCASIADFVEWSSENPDAAKAFTDVIALFAKAEGQAFIKACQYMNLNSDPQRETEESSKHVDAYVSFLKDNTEEIEKVLRKGMLVSSRMFLACASCFECLALADNIKAWAKKISPVKQQHKATRAWIDDPDNLKKAKKALVAILAATSKKTNKSKKSRLASDASSSSDAKKQKKAKKSKKTSSEDSCDASSSANKKKRKKNKRAKKDSSDSASGEGASTSSEAKPQKAKASKNKKKDNADDSDDKTNKKKRKAKNSSSSSSAEKAKKKPKKGKVDESKPKKLSDDAIAMAAGVGRSLITQSETQVFSATVDAILQNIGSENDGTFALADLQTVMAQLQPPVLGLFPEIEKAWSDICKSTESDGDVVKNTIAKAFISQLGDAGATMEAWHVDFAGKSSGAFIK